MEVQLGQRAKDVITGFEGVVTGKATYLTGCKQSLLSGKLKVEGNLTEGHWFDDDRLEITQAEAIILPKNDPGPDAMPPRRQ